MLRMVNYRVSEANSQVVWSEMSHSAMFLLPVGHSRHHQLELDWQDTPYSQKVVYA